MTDTATVQQPPPPLKVRPAGAEAFTAFVADLYRFWEKRDWPTKPCLTCGHEVPTEHFYICPFCGGHKNYQDELVTCRECNGAGVEQLVRSEIPCLCCHGFGKRAIWTMGVPS